jgi:hypothetical protein
MSIIAGIILVVVMYKFAYVSFCEAHLTGGKE